MPTIRVLCTRSDGPIVSFEPIDGPEGSDFYQNLPGGRIPAGLLEFDAVEPDLFEVGEMYAVEFTVVADRGDGVPRRRGRPLTFPARLRKPGGATARGGAPR